MEIILTNIVEDFFKPWEGEKITSWDEAMKRINAITIYPGANLFAWRGQSCAAWALHSSLYRKIETLTDKKFSSKDLDDRVLQKIEVPMINYLQDKWRFSDKSALEILATIQHYHGSTRLIDVTLNALVALYFAVEENEDEMIEKSDARVFAFSIDDRIVDIQKDTWKSSHLPWEGKFGSQDRWCVEPPLFWKPPTYNPRIQVQHSGFLLAGIPKVTSSTGSKLVRGPGRKHYNKYWSVTELRQVSSIPLRMSSVGSGVRPKELTFTFRIAAEAKPQIREKLSSMFNIDSSSIYPDDFGAAQAAEKFINTRQFE